MYQISLRWLACDSGNLFVAMQPSDPDVVIVGAGIAGASLATVLARSGLEVVLLERQREYSDRVRGWPTSSYTDRCYTKPYKVHPAFQNKNLLIFLNGSQIELAGLHAKVRRDGYRRPLPRRSH